VTDIEQLLRAQMDQTARRVAPAVADPTAAILRRARRTQRRRAVAAAGTAVVVAAAVVVAGAALRTQAEHTPGPIQSPSPSVTTTGPAPAPAVMPWVAYTADGPSGGEPKTDLHVLTPAGDHVVHEAGNAAVIVGGFLDGGRTLVYAEGNGDPAPWALSLGPDGTAVGSPRPLLGGSALVDFAIRPVLGGSGVAMRVLPAHGSQTGRLVRLGEHATVVSDVPIPDPSNLLLATERGALMAFRTGGSATTVVRMVGWDGSLGAPLGTVSGACPGGLADFWGPDWSAASYDAGHDRYAFTLPRCVGAAVGADATIFEATYAPGAAGPSVRTVSTKDFGGVSSLWYGPDGRLYWQPAGDVGQQVGVALVHAGPGAPVEHAGDDTTGVVRVALGPGASPWQVTMTYDAARSGPNVSAYTMTGTATGGSRVLGVTMDPDWIAFG
jgi:hypothetical protein